MQGQQQQNWLASLGDYFIALLGRENLAALLLGLGSILFPLGFIYANEQNFSPFETGVIRGLAVTLCAYFLARQTQSDLQFKSPWNFRYLILRNSIMVMQGLIFSLAQFYLPLTVASTLNSVSPLFVFIFDYYINGVSINRNQVMGVVASFAGVLLVVNGAPIMVFFDSEFEVDSDFKNYLTKSPLVMTLMSTAMLVAMAFHGYGVVMTKKLIKVNSIQINYILGLMILLTSSLGFPYKFSGPTLDVGQFAKGFLICGIPMALGQLMYIASLSLTKNFGAIATMQFMGIVFGYCVSIFRYHERVNLVSATGAVLIMGGIARVLMCRSN